MPDFTASPNASEEWQLMTKSTTISHTGSQVASGNAYIAVSSPIEFRQARLRQIESA